MFKINTDISDYDNVQNYIKYKNYIPKTDEDNIAEMILCYWDQCLEDEEISLQDFLSDHAYDLKEFDYNC